MSDLQYLRHRKARRITLANQATTTTLDTTNPITYTAYNVGGYREAILVTSVIANASADPYLQLQVSVDGGTNYYVHSTIHSDFTTTANVAVTTATIFGDMVRVRLVNATTSSSVRFNCKAVFKV